MEISTSDTKASSVASFMNILKCNIGTGVLSMPIAFAHAGWALGLAFLPVFGIICTHSMFLLVNSKIRLCKRLQVSELSFEETAEKAFSIGPEVLKPLAKTASKAVSLFLTLTQMGISIAYVLFVCESLKKVFSDYLPESGNIDIVYFIIILFPIMVLLNFIKTLKYLAVASGVANFLQGFGLLLLFTNLVQDIPSINERKMFDIKQFPLYFGTAVFSFEGIAIVLPVHDSMRKPDKFHGMTGILTIAMTVVTVLYMFLGTLGYLKYGNSVHGTITVDLPARDLFYEADRLMFAFAIFLSYPLQLYVPIHLFWPWFQEKLPENLQKSTTINNLYRTSLVLLTFVCAAVIPYLDLVISLVGALSSSFVALIIPPIIHLAAFWEERYTFKSGHWKWICLKAFLISTFGIIGSIMGTYTSVIALIQASTGGRTI